jgi:hypothetical protein
MTSGVVASDDVKCDAVDPNKFGEKESAEKISDREAKELARKKHNGEFFYEGGNREGGGN